MLATIIRLAEFTLTPSFHMAPTMFVYFHNLSPPKKVRMPKISLLFYVAGFDANVRPYSAVLCGAVGRRQLILNFGQKKPKCLDLGF